MCGQKPQDGRGKRGVRQSFLRDDGFEMWPKHERKKNAYSSPFFLSFSPFLLIHFRTCLPACPAHTGDTRRRRRREGERETIDLGPGRFGDEPTKLDIWPLLLLLLENREPARTTVPLSFVSLLARVWVVGLTVL